MMIPILILIFVLLTLVVGGERTSKSLVTLSANAIVLFIAIGSIYIGLNPLLISVLTCVIISSITVFYQNGMNEKTRASFLSVLIVLGIMLFLIWIFVYGGHLQGLPATGQNHISQSNGYAGDIGINMVLVEMATILVTLVGAVIDTAIAVISGMYEVVKNNPTLKTDEWFRSGLTIGGDILNGTINTLFFIFAGEYLVMFINFAVYYSFDAMINSKEFAQSTITILISAVGCVVVIPVAAFIAARMFKRSLTQTNSDVKPDQSILSAPEQNSRERGK